MSPRPSSRYPSSRRPRAACLLAALALLGSALPSGAASKATSAPADTGLTFAAFHDAFVALAADPARGAAVRGLEIRRDAGTLRLEDGTLHLCAPVAGRTCAAVFTGRATFQLRPPMAVERAQLARVLGSDSLAEPLEAVVLVWADSTGDELARSLTFGERPVASRAGPALAECVSNLLGPERKRHDLDPTVVGSLLEGARDGMFYAHLCRPGREPLFFQVDPGATEAVSLMQWAADDMRLAGQGRVREAVCQFPRAEALQVDPAADRVPDLDATAYRIDVRLTRSLGFRASAEVDLVARQPRRWLVFSLFEELALDSVQVDGAPAAFFKGEKSPRVWVRAPATLAPGQAVTVRMAYHGELLRSEQSWVTLRSSCGWYPRHDEMARATFDVTYHLPTGYQFASVGRRVSSETRDGVVTARYVTPRPVRNVSFNIGSFKELNVSDPRIPPVQVQMFEAGHRDLDAALGEEGQGSGKGMERQVAADVANSVAFFQSVFGPPPDSAIVATEIPQGHGEAFPGMVGLSWATFQNTSTSGFDEVFRAHEIAHQWWAIGVDFKTYRDQWLSEGFAEYAGLWYLQAARRDNDRFFARLDESRKEILGNRHYLLGKGKQAGPIWLGERTDLGATRGDYDLIIYEKGAWVLHMLRNMLLDLQTMSDERFRAMLRDFYQTYAGGKASTMDFRSIVEKHVGEDMGWFFDEWVDGTDVPTYRFAWKAEPTGGTWTVTCRVDQSGVPDGFRMYVPILIRFPGDKYARVRALIDRPHAEFQLPPVPLQPKDVTFNDMSSVLCEVKNEKW